MNIVSITDLTAKSAPDILREYANKLPDGKAVSLSDLVEILGIPKQTLDSAARRLKITIAAYPNDGTASKRQTYITNPKTAAAWQKAQNQSR